MTDWTSGYVADIGYTYGYYTELNPQRNKLAFINSGLVPPSNGYHCELGFGQGLSVNIHSAASNSDWYATDFNPSQASFAQTLSLESQSKAKLFDDSFEDFCRRTDLPDFDSIGMHGIWSWISDENRTHIVDFIRRKLKVGGALYISYNTQPGWAVFAPVRHLMAEHASLMGSAGMGVVNRINEAINFTEKLLSVNPLFARANPSVIERLEKVKSQDRHYLAHEYFNKDWHPMHFTSMAEWLSPAKVSYACSANYLDHIDTINFTTEQQSFLKSILDQNLKEGVKDFISNQQFRRDYWVKGARKLSVLEQRDLLNKQLLVLTSPSADVSMKITSGLGEAELNQGIYQPILEALSDHQVKSIGDIKAKLGSTKIDYSQLIQACMVLVGLGHVSSAQEENTIKNSVKSCNKLNQTLIEKSRFNADISWLASPITGGGIAVNRIQQLFLLAQNRGEKKTEQWAQTAWKELAENNQRLIKDGKAIQSEEENLAELNKQAKEFSEKRLPILKALGVL